MARQPEQLGTDILGGPGGPARSPDLPRLAAGRKALLVLLVMVVVAACTQPDNVLERSFNDVDELVSVLNCDGQWIHADWRVPAGEEEMNSSRVVAEAKVIMGTGARPVAADAVQAGNVWVLVNDAGQPFGGWAPGAELVWCSEG